MHKTAVILFFLFHHFLFASGLERIDLELGSRISEALCMSDCYDEDIENGPCMMIATDCHCPPADMELNETENVGPFINSTGIQAPEVKCKEDNLAHLVWERQENTTYFLEMWNGDEKRYITDVTRCDQMTLPNLKSNMTYKARLWSISYENQQTYNSEYMEFTTQDRNLDPFPVANLTLDKMILIDDHYDAVIKWTPSKDMSCFYHIVWFGGDELGNYDEIEIDDTSNPDSLRLTDLTFNTNYSVTIRAKRPDLKRESDSVDLHINVPSCLDSYASLDKCPPEKPKILSISETEVPENKSLYNIQVTWAEPNFIPEYYYLELKHLPPKENYTVPVYQISGNQTEASIENVLLDSHYQISLTAWSKGGISKRVSRDRHRERTVTSQDNQQRWSVLEMILTIIGTCCGVIIFLGTLMVCSYYKARNDLEEKSPKGIECVNSVYTVPDNPDEWELNPNDLIMQAVLGEGAFGVVRRAYLQTKTGESKQVAIKMLKDSPTAEEVRQLVQEIEILKSVKRHLHVVSLIGCITQGRPEGPLLVVEYCSRGDLQTYLRSAWDKIVNVEREIQYTDQGTDGSMKQFANQTYGILDGDLSMDYNIQPKHLISVARQVALGMEHLAKTRVVHRDLAARNILICEDGTVKVSDFGLSRDVYQENVYCKLGGGKLPIRWMALESLTHQRYTTQSDVWSFGILLWEIVTLGATPYPGVSSQDLLSILKSGYRLEKPHNCSTELYFIMRSCWKTSPKDRPTFTDLVQNLNNALENVSHYLTLEVKPPVQFFTYKPNKMEPKTYSSERYVKPITIFR